MHEIKLGGSDLFRWTTPPAGNGNPMQNMQNKYALLDSMETDKKPSIQLPGLVLLLIIIILIFKEKN